MPDSSDFQLRRELGLLEAVSIVVGRIIGSGIFRTPGPMMIAVAGLDTDLSYRLSGIPTGQLSVGLFFLAWLIGGLATWLSALVYAELVAMLPRSGGPYEYLKQAYPDWVTFLRGWAMFFVSETASIVAVALVFSNYASWFLEEALGLQLHLFGESLAALGIIWLLTFANYFGVFASGVLQNIFSFVKFSSLLLLIAFAFGSDAGSGSHFSGHLWPESMGWQTLVYMGAALRFAFFAFSGWEGATYVAEEVRNPAKNLPRSIFLGIGAVLLVYFGVNAAYVYVLDPASIIVAKKNIASVAMKKALGSWGGLFLAAAVVISTFGNVSTQILVKARTWYAMARDGLFFRGLGRLSRNGTPRRALLAQALWASALLFFAAYSDYQSATGGFNAYDRIISFFSFTSAVFNVLTFASVVILRKKRADLARPFRVPAFGLTISLTLLIYISFMILTLLDKPVESLLGLLLTASGFLYYFFVVKKQ